MAFGVVIWKYLVKCMLFKDKAGLILSYCYYQQIPQEKRKEIRSISCGATGVVPIRISVSEMPPKQPKMLDWVSANTRVYALIRHNVIY